MGYALLACGILLGVGAVLVVWGTIRKNRWGMHFENVYCPKCGTEAPMTRKPKSTREALWGGWTCSACGTEIDKWGREINRS